MNVKGKVKMSFYGPKGEQRKAYQLNDCTCGRHVNCETFLYKLVYTLQETVHFNLKSISRLNIVSKF